MQVQNHSRVCHLHSSVSSIASNSHWPNVLGRVSLLFALLVANRSISVYAMFCCNKWKFKLHLHEIAGGKLWDPLLCDGWSGVVYLGKEKTLLHVINLCGMRRVKLTANVCLNASYVHGAADIWRALGQSCDIFPVLEGEWKAWRDWGQCSGEGFQIRRRDCKVEPCVGERLQERSCEPTSHSNCKGQL